MPSPWQAPEPVTRLELSLPAVTESVREARTAVGEHVARLIGKGTVVADVRLCVTEAVTNVVRHAYSFPSAEERVDVGVDSDDGELRIVVRDSGRGIVVGEPRRTPGGYGLEIIDRLTTRHTVVTARGTGTEIAMIFALDPSVDSAPHVHR
jgi:anti-sigma regulatory factor (Ser/Thr protein kinase)